jgi:hypothetical protein
MGTAATQAEALKRKRAVSDTLLIRPARQLSPTPAPRASRLRKNQVRFKAVKNN